MASNANSISPLPTPVLPTADAVKAPAPVPSLPPAADPAVSADYRLVIDEDPKSGTFVYKTVNPATGDVIYQVPREELLRLRDNPSYHAGSVVKTRA